MRSIGQQDGPQSAEDFEVFKGLHLVGRPGRVRVTVSERKLSIEQKSGHGIDISHDWVMRLNHSSKPLLPNGYALLGGIFIWVAFRGMVIGTASQLLVVGLGLLLLIGRFGTSRPTLTIETQALDCHILTGNDAVLMRLCHLHTRLCEGQSMDIARLGLDELQRDVDYPRSEATPIIPALPVHLDAPLSIASLISNHGNEGQVQRAAQPLEYLGQEEPLELDFEEPQTEGWMFGEPELASTQRPEIEHGVIQRGRANARQGHLVPNHHAPQQEPMHYNHPAHPYPVAQPVSVDRSYGRIAELNQNLPRPNTVEETNHALRDFLPSFVGPEGAHVPATQPEPMPIEAPFDEELSNLFSDDEPSLSLVDAARRDDSVLDAELAPAPVQSPINRSQYRIQPRNSGFDNPRFFNRNRMRGNGTRVQSFIEGIGRSASLAGQFLTGAPSLLPTTPVETESSQELRERSSRTHQQEIENSVANLSDQRGGVLPEEELALLTQHIDRRHTLAEQIQQERGAAKNTIDLDELNFVDLVEKDEQHTGLEPASSLES